VILCGLLLVQQAAIGDCLSFDPFPFDQNGLASPEVDVGRRQVTDALMISQAIEQPKVDRGILGLVVAQVLCGGFCDPVGRGVQAESGDGEKNSRTVHRNNSYYTLVLKLCELMQQLLPLEQ
jgi:hypothetical protein